MLKKQSRRSRRLARQQKARKVPALNLVSLMDIFTILVFFLLVNTSSDQELPNQEVLTLPVSSSQSTPEETLKVMVTKEEVLVQGRSVIDLEALRQSDEDYSPALKDELDYRRSLSVSARNADTLTVLADEQVPYEILKKILTTGQHADYIKIAFAANKVMADDNE